MKDTFDSLLVLVIAFALVMASPLPSRQRSPTNPPAPTVSVPVLIKDAFRAAYSLDYNVALDLARRSVTVAPDDPASHRTLATVLWLEILFRRGDVTIDHYLGNVARPKILFPKPPEDLAAEFRRAVDQAIDLANTRLKRDTRNIQARYELGASYAILASYTASVEGSLVSAFGSARRAYDAADDVLSRQPQRADASLIAGTYRYVISTLSMPTRMLAYLAGFSGGKEKGISMIEMATGDPETRTDASLALLLIYSRESRFPDALKKVRELETEYPRNRLFVLEEGATAIRAGRHAEAETTLTRGLAAFDVDNRLKIPGERALWLYKRGVARVALRHADDARADLAMALQSGPVDWVRGRITIEQGKLADLAGRRSEAIAVYRQAKAICDAAKDTKCSEEASRLAARPYK